MKSITKYIFITNFLSIFSYATVFNQATNKNKFDYHDKNKSSITSKKITQISPLNHANLKTIDKNYFVKKIAINVEGVNYQGNFDFIHKEYLNSYINNERISALNKQLVKYFINQDYLLPRIMINEKDLNNGILNITVKISTLDNIVIVGDSDELIQTYANKILDEKPSKVKHTQKYLALINKVPSYKVSYRIREDLQTNKDDKSIDLVLISQRLKGEVLAHADNNGTDELGKEQALIEAQRYSLFKDGDSLAFTGLASNHPNRLYDLGLKYGVPVNNIGTYAYLAASYAKDNPNKSSSLSIEDNHQSSFSFMVAHPLYLTASQELEINLGTHFKTLTNYGLSNYNSSVKTDSSKYWSINMGLEYLFKDKLDGYNIIKTNLIQGINGDFKNYQDQNDIADKHFNLATLDIYREQLLVNDFSLFIHLSANYSNKKLPEQELFILGGREFGRGYQFSTIDGNKMMAASFEARYNRNLKNQFLEQIQPFVFIDTGHIGNQPSNTNISTLSSAGAGLRFKFANDINLSTEIAQPFKRNYVVDGNNIKAGTRFNIFLNKIFKF